MRAIKAAWIMAVIVLMNSSRLKLSLLLKVSALIESLQLR